MQRRLRAEVHSARGVAEGGSLSPLGRTASLPRDEDRQTLVGVAPLSLSTDRGVIRGSVAALVLGRDRRGCRVRLQCDCSVRSPSWLDPPLCV